MNRIIRRLILLLGIVYALSGTGLASFVLQSAHDYYAHVIFPCKGNGCACDKAGYELRGCRCDHTKVNNSCCSKEAVIESCCAKKAQSTCCSDSDAAEEPASPQIKAPGCQGETDEGNYSIVKHCPINFAEDSHRYLFHMFEHRNSVKQLFSREFFPPGKVPIFS